MLPHTQITYSANTHVLARCAMDPGYGEVASALLRHSAGGKAPKTAKFYVHVSLEPGFQ